MKNYFRFLGFAFAVLMLASCQPNYKKIGSIAKPSGALGICRNTKDGPRYGLWSTVMETQQDYIALPPIFTKIEYADQGFVFVYPDNTNLKYLFSIHGQEVVTGRQSGERKIGFAPLPVKSMVDLTKDHLLNYGASFAAEQPVSEITLCSGRIYWQVGSHLGYYIIGPADNIVPGRASHIVRRDGKSYADIHKIADEDFKRCGFDEVIEVVYPVCIYNEAEFWATRGYKDIAANQMFRSIFFMRKGSTWQAYEYRLIGFSQPKLKPVLVDQKLLNKVLQMPCRAAAKQTNQDVFGPDHNQRFGCEGASVVIL